MLLNKLSYVVFSVIGISLMIFSVYAENSIEVTALAMFAGIAVMAKGVNSGLKDKQSFLAKLPRFIVYIVILSGVFGFGYLSFQFYYNAISDLYMNFIVCTGIMTSYLFGYLNKHGHDKIEEYENCLKTN